MPKKIRELIKDLENVGFINRGGKGSHRNFVHPSVRKPNPDKPEPMPRPLSGKDFVNVMQKVA